MTILTSLHGLEVGLTRSRRLQNKAGFVSGPDNLDLRLDSDPAGYTFWDDFMGDTLNTFRWHNPTKGSDGGTVDFAVTQAVNGTAAGTTGAGAGATMAVNGILIDGGLDFKANSGGLVFQSRVKTSAITNLCLYVGLTDQVSTLEMPFTISGSTITSNATDAVGFLFDTAATAATWKLLGVANDVDATLQEAVQSTTTLTTAPVAATFTTLRIEVGTDGTAVFYIDGKKVGTKMTGAVTATIALTPVIAAFTRSAASATITADYVHVSANRV